MKKLHIFFEVFLDHDFSIMKHDYFNLERNRFVPLKRYTTWAAICYMMNGNITL